MEEVRKMTRGKRFFFMGLCLMLTLLMALPASPAAAYNNFYARNTVKNLRIRSEPNLSRASKGHLQLNQIVWVIEEAYDGNTRMFQVEYLDGDKTRQTGWVAGSEGTTDYMEELTDAEVAALNPTSTGALPTNITATSTSSGSSSDSSSGSSGSSGSSSSSTSYAGTYIKLGSKSSLVKEVQQKLKDLSLYSGDITGTVGTRTVEAIKSFQKKKGFSADGIAGPTTLAALLGGSSGSSESSSSSSTSTATAGDLGYTKADKVHLRSGPSTKDSSKSLLPNNTVFSVLNTQAVSGYTWYYVELWASGGGKGYIRGDMLGIMSTAEAAAYRNGQGTPSDGTSTGTSTGTDSGSSSGSTVTSGMARITASNVNVRSGPSSENSTNGKAQRNDVFTINGSQAANGVTWYNLTGRSTNLSGWVHGSYVHVMTDTEIAEYNSSGSSSSSGSTSSGTSGSTTTYRLLKYGSKGDDVKKLQQALKDKGYYSGSVTGNYGTNTETAVRSFQKKNGLYVDGIAGTNTQATIFGTTAADTVPTPTISAVLMPE